MRFGSTFLSIVILALYLSRSGCILWRNCRWVVLRLYGWSEHLPLYCLLLSGISVLNSFDSLCFDWPLQVYPWTFVYVRYFLQWVIGVRMVVARYFGSRPLDLDLCPLLQRTPFKIRIGRINGSLGLCWRGFRLYQSEMWIHYRRNISHRRAFPGQIYTTISLRISW